MISENSRLSSRELEDLIDIRTADVSAGKE